MKLNNKGFTFIEILAVIVLIGVLSSIAIVGVSKYRENAKNKDYEALAKASYNAMEEYMMSHPYKKEVSLETLDNGNFLSNRTDPGTKSTDCSGAVIVETKEEGSAGTMDKNEYKVHLCCTNYKKTYTYPDGTADELENESYCDYEDVEEETTEIPQPLPGETSYTITYVLNEGTVSGNPDKYAESMLPFTLKNPTRSGYTFTGWTGSNGTTPQTTVTIPNGSTRDKTYTANWTQNQVETKPTCSIKVSSGTKGNNNWYKSDVTITMTVTPTNTTTKGLATTENSTNGKTSVTITKDGTYTYYGYVKNSAGTGKCSQEIKRDVTKPTCGTATGTSTKWTKNNRTIKQPCSDSTSKCVKNSYETTYKTNTKTASKTIEDKAGNTKTCTYNVYVDKSAPTATFCRTTQSSSKRKCVHGKYCIKIDYKDNYELGIRSNLKESWAGSTVSWPDVNLSSNVNNDELAVGYSYKTLKVISVTVADEAGNKSSYSNKAYSALSQCT